MTRRDVVGGHRVDPRDHLVEGRDLALDELRAPEAAHAARRRLERHRERAGEVALRGVELGGAGARRATSRSSSRLDHVERLLHPLGRGAGVDREIAGVVERGAVRVHGVREAALLAHLLEQPRRHAAAERLVHDRERVRGRGRASRTERRPSTRWACSVGRCTTASRLRRRRLGVLARRARRHRLPGCAPRSAPRRRRGRGCRRPRARCWRARSARGGSAAMPSRGIASIVASVPSTSRPSG